MTWILTATSLGSTIAWLIIPIFKETKLLAETDHFTISTIHGAVSGVLSTTFLVSLIITVRLAYVCTASVPTDVLVHKQRELRI